MRLYFKVPICTIYTDWHNITDAYRQSSNGTREKNKSTYINVQSTTCILGYQQNQWPRESDVWGDTKKCFKLYALIIAEFQPRKIDNIYCQV